MKFLNKILGDPTQKFLNTLKPLVEKTNGLESEFSTLSDERLREKTGEFKNQIQSGAKLDDMAPQAFAAVREAAKRTLLQRHYDVQLLGGLCLHYGHIAEMKTGEGKTLTATLSAYLNALSGDGVHIVTVNDYLARRDTAWMGQIYNLLGLTVSCIQHERAFKYDSTVVRDEQDNKEELEKIYKVDQDHLREISRKEAYQSDITYGTNNEFGFDYLRDNMVYKLDDMVQRDLNYAIVDEVDSILIDEARTPLIISMGAEESTEKYYKYAQVLKSLAAEDDYKVDEKFRSAVLTEQGISKVEKILGMKNIYASGVEEIHLLEQALQAMTLFKKDKDYVIKEGEIVIVDEFTGRLMFGRRYSEGLHQAIEAKEGVEIKRESRTLATVTFQNYFRLYKKLAGMTGTAATEAEEFYKIYGLEVSSVPTDKPMIRSDLQDRVYKTEEGKFKEVVHEISDRHSKGQPLLVGTISIEKNEKLSALLQKAGVKHELLNAKNHEKEAQIIAQAGRFGAVTVATNMAGRGVDIILGGNPPDAKEALKVKNLGGLHVLGTERHESRRIDNQLRGRSGRQGDQGSSQFFVSLDDDLMRIFGSDRLKSLMTRLGVPEDMPIENKVVSKSIESAQQKVEGHNFDIRKHLVEYDDVTNKQREIIYQKRREILKASAEKGDLKKKILGLTCEELNQIVDNADKLYEAVNLVFRVEEEEKKEFGDNSSDEIKKYLHGLAAQKYTEEDDENIERMVYLRSIDNAWMEHLESLDYLRHGIGLRGYAQKDPLVEYKRESYNLFKNLLGIVEKEVVYSIYKIKEAMRLTQTSMAKKFVESTASSAALTAGKNKKLGRNEACFCNSGKKFKRCHGA